MRLEDYVRSIVGEERVNVQIEAFQKIHQNHSAIVRPTIEYDPNPDSHSRFVCSAL